jgi:hypothetical protein
MKIFKSLIKRFLVSSLIYLLGITGWILFKSGHETNVVSLFLIGVVYIYACFINAIFTPIIYFIEKKSILISLFLFLIITWFLSTLIKNENDFTNYENWQHFNHQTIILPKLDYFIGSKFIEIRYTTPLILINLIIGILRITYLKFRKKNIA